MSYLNQSGYVYKVVNSITGQFYIGTRAFSQSAGIVDIGDSYFTASSNAEFVEQFKESPENFTTSILYTGNDFLNQRYSIIKAVGIFPDNKMSLNLRNLAPKFTGFGKTGFCHHSFGLKMDKTNQERTKRLNNRISFARSTKNRKLVQAGNLIIKIQNKADIKLTELNSQMKELKKQMGKLYKAKNVSENISEIKTLKEIMKNI